MRRGCTHPREHILPMAGHILPMAGHMLQMDDHTPRTRDHTHTIPDPIIPMDGPIPPTPIASKALLHRKPRETSTLLQICRTSSFHPSRPNLRAALPTTATTATIVTISAAYPTKATIRHSHPNRLVLLPLPATLLPLSRSSRPSSSNLRIPSAVRAVAASVTA